MIKKSCISQKTAAKVENIFIQVVSCSVMDSNRNDSETEMVSNTTTAVDDGETRNDFFYGSQLVTFSLLVINAWATASFVKYGRARGVWRQKLGSSSMLLHCSALAPLLTLLRLIVSETLIVYGRVGDGRSACRGLVIVHTLLYAAALITNHLFLYFRQRALYSAPALRRAQSRVSRVASVIVLPLTLSALLAVCVLFLVNAAPHSSSSSSEVTCARELDDVTPSHVMIAVTLTLHIVTFALFFYPLRRHTSAPRQEEGGGNLHALLRQACVGVSLAISSEALALSLASLLLRRYPDVTVATTCIYDLNLTLNNMSVMISYQSWRRIAFILCRSDERSIADQYHRRHATTSLSRPWKSTAAASS